MKRELSFEKLNNMFSFRRETYENLAGLSGPWSVL